MTLAFKYKVVRRPDGSHVKTPSIPVVFSTSKKVETIGLIDSGADISVISQEMAEILGLDMRIKRTPAFGIGGRVDAVDTNVNITTQKGHEKHTFKIPVKVILGNYDFPALLGRAGFFDKFVISFDQAQEKVSLKRVIRR